MRGKRPAKELVDDEGEVKPGTEAFPAPDESVVKTEAEALTGPLAKRVKTEAMSSPSAGRRAKSKKTKSDATADFHGFQG